MLNKLRRFVRKQLAKRLHVPEIPISLERLKAQGFNPNFIFDVGAYRGDFARECLRIWPDTRIACFEPQRHKKDELEKLRRISKNKVTVHPYLLGASIQKEMVLNEAETASSVLVEYENTILPKAVYPMKTIDSVVLSEFEGRSPDFIKIDVQGYELEVLKGANNTLQNVKALLIEVNFLDIHVNVPLHASITSWLNDRGFVAFDVCGLTRRPLDHALWQVDIIFVRDSSPLRRDKRWTA